jgi:hypothetical protein
MFMVVNIIGPILGGVIARELGLSLVRVVALLDELEKNMTLRGPDFLPPKQRVVLDNRRVL